MSNLRYIAARVIDSVTDGRSLSDSLDNQLSSIKDSRDRGFVQAVCYGVCRFYTQLDIILSHLLQKPMNANDSDVHALLLVGIYQLMAMRIPDYAAVTETVNATEKLNKSWARGFVNAILRNYLRERESIEKEIQDDPEGLYAHPEWWIDEIKKQWPDQWQDILNANNQHPPFALRVNQQKISREDYINQLTDHVAHGIPETQCGIILETPIPAEELPGFYEGEVSVQDGAAQLAAEILNLSPQLHVLDACAAPGGKLLHMLEMEPTLTVVAIEKDQARLASIKENLARLKFHAEYHCADAANIDRWWDKKPFDRILLDAPCSASGVVRRHPDIKLLRQLNDIKAFAKEQLHLLSSLWPLLKPGGLFLYVTCSIFPEENVEVIKKFIATHADVQEEKIQAEWGVGCEIGRQILPGMHNMDGFYYALLRKLG